MLFFISCLFDLLQLYSIVIILLVLNDINFLCGAVGSCDGSQTRVFFLSNLLRVS